MSTEKNFIYGLCIVIPLALFAFFNHKNSNPFIDSSEDNSKSDGNIDPDYYRRMPDPRSGLGIRKTKKHGKNKKNRKTKRK
jgi:hypothetical protein